MDANRLPPLGWPWDALLDAARRLERADQAMLAAGTAGDAMARCAAELDRSQAIIDWNRIKDEQALVWLAGFRAALERYPASVAGLLGDLPPCRRLTEAIDELEDRVDAAEDVVVDLVRRRAV
jgi:hypothetical protein